MPKRAGLIWVSLFAVACGGEATPPAESPDNENEPSETQAEESSEAPSGESSEAPSGEAAAEPSGGDSALSDEDIRDALQQVLDDPGLDRYLHLDVRGRLPLKLSGPGLPAKLELIKGSHAVKIVDGPASAKDPVLVFTKIERDGESVRMRYRYDVEGIEGSAVVFRKSGVWTLGSNRLIEK